MKLGRRHIRRSFGELEEDFEVEIIKNTYFKFSNNIFQIVYFLKKYILWKSKRNNARQNL